MGTRAFLRLLRPKSRVLLVSLVPVLLFVLALIPMTVTAQVTVHSDLKPSTRSQLTFR